jgi:hypothetical protein
MFWPSWLEHLEHLARQPAFSMTGRLRAASRWSP